MCRLAAALLLAFAAMLYPASIASATTVDVECVGSFERSFDPAVTLTHRR
jgi:hypothetical protein